MTQDNIEIIHQKDDTSGLEAFIALCGDESMPAIGGCRVLPYASSEEAKIEAERLATSMYFKAKSHDLPLSGGKAVIMKPENMNEQQLWPAFARMINGLEGRYITAVDSGTSESVMNLLSGHTKYITCHSEKGGDPSFYTAKGVMIAIETVCEYRFDSRPLHILVQGAGKVGRQLIEMLLAAGHRVTASDIHPEALEGLDITIIEPEALFTVECDVFAPCALGRVITPEVVDQLKAQVICGAANDTLLDESVIPLLEARGILYCPDYVVNGGGLICCYAQYNGLTSAWVEQKLLSIKEILIKNVL